MSEENRKQNPELREAALSGVSGGTDYWVATAKAICGLCPRGRTKSCKLGAEHLAEYLRQSGLREINKFNQCPFFGR